MNDLIEMRIIEAVRELLVGRVNDLLREVEYSLPVIEFSDYCCGYAVVPVITLTECERTEKERIIRLDAYSMTITFTLPDAVESELYCYAYAGAVSRAIYDNPTLDGVADRAVITNKKYVSPRKPRCGEGWQIIFTLRITVQLTGNR